MRRRILLLTVTALLAAPPALGHEGPPFPIIVDAEVGPYTVSLWTDPDIGIGTFFVVMERTDGGDVQDGVSVRVGVAPESGRLDEVIWTGARERVRRGARFVAEVEFDQGEWWHVRLLIEGPDGGGELESRVEATPDGTIGPIGLIFYMLPFLAVGFLWFKAVRVKRQGRTTTPPDTATTGA